MKFIHIIFTLLFILIAPIHTLHAKAHYEPYNKHRLQEAISEAIQPYWHNTDITVYVKSMTRGDVLFSHNIRQPLMPASTSKIFTAEAALIHLGTDYRFNTRLLTDAKEIQNGALQGNVYLVLSGDPTLTYSDIVDLFYQLKERHITSIHGNVYIDDTAFDRQFYSAGWNEKDKGYCFSAPISAGIINHNCLPMHFKPGKKPGASAQIKTSPHHYYPTIYNNVITKGKRVRCYPRLAADIGSLIALEGCMGMGRYGVGLSYVISNPTAYNQALVKGVLKQLDLKVSGQLMFKQAPKNLTLLDSHQSKPLSDLVHDMLKKSDNIIAAALFKKLGQVTMQRPGSWENGSIAVSRILSQHTRMNTYGLRLQDGSGLSRNNLTTAEQMMRVLEYAYMKNQIRDAFIDALPIAGVDGTLKYRLRNATRRVRAKTGTISGVVSLAGYAEPIQGDPVAFVIIINGSRGLNWRYKAIEDRIVNAIIQYRG